MEDMDDCEYAKGRRRLAFRCGSRISYACNKVHTRSDYIIGVIRCMKEKKKLTVQQRGI